MKAVLDALIDVLLPPSCAACDAVLPQAGAFCADCAMEVLEIPSVHCARCAEPGSYAKGTCARCETSPWVRAYAPFEHEGKLARAIHRFKYEDRSDLARPLGMLLTHSAGPVLANMRGALVPLPLHEARFRARKFDQAALLAAVVARETGRPLELSWLRRVRDTPRQVGLSELERERNVAGAFDVTSAVRDQQVVLVDDVLTSGASAREATRVLLEAGAREVFVLTLARACQVFSRADSRR